MTMGLMYWILMLIWLVFGFWWHWPNWAPWLGGSLFLFILLLLLGWRVFGPPIHG